MKIKEKYTAISDKQGIRFIKNDFCPVFVLLDNQEPQLITSHHDFNNGIYTGGKLAIKKINK